MLGRVLAQRGDVDGEVGGAVGERHTLLERGVGVQHRRGDRRVVGVDRRLERVERHVRRAGLDEDLGRRRPEHHDPIDLLLLAEAVDVLADRVEHRALVDGVDHVVGVEPLDVAAVERGRHRAHVAQRFGDALEVAAGLEYAGPLGGDVGVVGERIPRAEHDVVEVGDRHEVLDQRAALFGALAEADRVHQRERADRVGHAALDELDAGDERRGDGAETDGQDTEAPVGWLDGWSWGSGHRPEARADAAPQTRTVCFKRSRTSG